MYAYLPYVERLTLGERISLVSMGTCTIRYLRCISTNLSVPTTLTRIRMPCVRTCGHGPLCAEREGERVDTKLRHLIFTHLLEKHLCEISIYNTLHARRHQPQGSAATRRQKQHYIYSIFGSERAQRAFLMAKSI